MATRAIFFCFLIQRLYIIMSFLFCTCTVQVNLIVDLFICLSIYSFIYFSIYSNLLKMNYLSFVFIYDNNSSSVSKSSKNLNTKNVQTILVNNIAIITIISIIIFLNLLLLLYTRLFLGSHYFRIFCF